MSSRCFTRAASRGPGVRICDGDWVEKLHDGMRESEKDGVSQIAVRCFHCHHGRYELVTRDEVYPMTDGSRMLLPRVNYLRCVECGEELLTSESDRYILEFGPPKVDTRALWEEHEAANKESPHSCGDAERNEVGQ